MYWYMNVVGSPDEAKTKYKWKSEKRECSGGHTIIATKLNRIKNKRKVEKGKKFRSNERGRENERE